LSTRSWDRQKQKSNNLLSYTPDGEWSQNSTVDSDSISIKSKKEEEEEKEHHKY